MLYKSNVPVTIEINTVQDLSKLGAFMKHNNLKVNKSEIARALNINRRTVTKYLNGFQKCTHRNKPSRLDKYTDIISELLSSNTQVFAYIDESERVEVERKFNLAKRQCGIGLIVTRLKETTCHCLAMSVLVLNLRKIGKVLFTIFYRGLKNC